MIIYSWRTLMRIARRMMQNQTYCSESATTANAYIIFFWEIKIERIVRTSNQALRYWCFIVRSASELTRWVSWWHHVPTQLRQWIPRYEKRKDHQDFNAGSYIRWCTIVKSAIERWWLSAEHVKLYRDVMWDDGVLFSRTLRTFSTVITGWRLWDSPTTAKKKVNNVWIKSIHASSVKDSIFR